MQFRINAASTYDFQTDRVSVGRRIIDGEIVNRLDRSRDLRYNEAVVTIEIRGVAKASSSHSASISDVWQEMVDEAVSGNTITLTPALDEDSSVTVDVIPVPGQGPDHWRTDGGDKELERTIQLESDSTFDSTAAIWDSLKDLDSVL